MDNLTRTRMWRLMQLERRIRSGDYPNCSSFARELAELNGMKQPYDRKTIQRDIDFLRDQMRAPVEYDQTRKGYFYRDRTWSFPMLDLTEGELLSLLLAEQMARQFTGTPLGDSLQALFDKICMTFTEKTTIDPVFARKQFSFHSHPVRPINQQVWETLLEGLRSERVVKMKYKGIQDGESKSRQIEPIHISCVDGDWYVVGYCKQCMALRHFAISRIMSLTITDEEFSPKEFDPDIYFSNRFGRFIGKPDEYELVKVRFSKSSAPWILERIWHPKQNILKHKDGSLTLSFPAPSMFEVKRWVLQWGKEAEVLAPHILREDVRKDRELH